MDFPSFTPLPHQKQISEGSRLRPLRDSEGLYENWKFGNDQSKQIDSLSENVKTLNKRISELYRPDLIGLQFHPFKIYQYPSILRTSLSEGSNPDSSGSTDWRKVRVRGGHVLTSFITPLTSSMVNGTDNIEYSDNQIYPTEGNGSLDYIVPANTQNYWFWVETTGSVGNNTYYLRSGATPQSSSTYNPNPWTTFPTVDANHTIVGYVDTVSSASNNQIYIRQFLRTDIMQLGGTIQLQVCDPAGGPTKVYYFYGYLSGSI